MSDFSQDLKEEFAAQNPSKTFLDSICKKASVESFVPHPRQRSIFNNEKVLTVYEAFELMHKIDGTSDGRRKYDATL